MEFNFKTLICCEIIGYLILNTSIVIIRPTDYSTCKLIITYLMFSVLANVMWMLIDNVNKNFKKIADDLCDYFKFDQDEISNNENSQETSTDSFNSDFMVGYENINKSMSLLDDNSETEELNVINNNDESHLLNRSCCEDKNCCRNEELADFIHSHED